jgi:SOS response regulatory protein OraA/RecX
VDLVVEYLTIKNVLNDRRTALSYLRSKEGRRAVGRFRIEQDLRSKGVTENVIAEVCDELEDGSRAKGLLASKFRPEPELKPKAFRFLVSRGFQYDAAHQAVREFFAGGVEED